MAYVKKALGRPDGGAGNPSPKNPTILLCEVEDVESFPTREIGKTVYTDGFKLKEGRKLQPIYATPSSIEITQAAEGDADARGYKKGVKFEHPGVSTDIEDFVEYAANRNFIAVVRSCDGGPARVIGSLCNPLSLKSETTDNKDGAKNAITLEEGLRDAFRVMNYTGDLPDILGATSEDSSESETI
ncbi:hypothetical protein [uncultured Alistipes sp.]|uniref:hypothetical protein n=1 Tax=uncultured Alistipes sp. TaxID=538949 RepID=UPI00272B9981|nr:hypothetical protein [uncultured Alistipes sp.]